jgi:hypothetical protein
MNSRNVVFTFTNDGKSFRILEPRLFKVTVKNGFSLSINNTSRDNVSLNTWSLSCKNKIFYFFNFSVFFTSLSLLIVSLSKCMIKIFSLELLLFHCNGFNLGRFRLRFDRSLVTLNIIFIIF